MRFVATLIMPADRAGDGHAHAATAHAALQRLGAGPGEITWLAPGIAAEIPCAAAGSETISGVRQALGQAPVDVVVQPVDGRRKRLLVADLESTIIEQECLDEMATFVGKRSEIAAITAKAMRGEIDFAGALRERVAMLTGLSVDVLQAVYEQRVRLNPGATALVATMRRAGAFTALVSGGFTFFTSRIADRLGFAYHQGNELELDGTRLTGRVREPILGREAKRRALERLRGELGIEPSATMAVGDGANDLDMIAAAGLGVAYHAKPAVAAAAAARIDHADLTALLYLQGYKATEIVAA